MPYEAAFIDGNGKVVRNVILASGVRDFDVTPPGVRDQTVVFHREGRNDRGSLVPSVLTTDGLSHTGSLIVISHRELSSTKIRKTLRVPVKGNFDVEVDSGDGDVNGRVEMRFSGCRGR